MVHESLGLPTLCCITRRELRRLETELNRYIDSFVSGMGREERRRALGWYITGLLLEGDRKSMEPMASRLVESFGERNAMRQRLQDAVCTAGWSETEVYKRLAGTLDAELPGVEALVVDDTGLPKQGKCSVGVARQYSGTLGRTGNCQVMVSLHMAGERGSGCIGMQLYLPEASATDMARRGTVGIPDDVVFAKKWQIALHLLDAALGWGVRQRVVLADAGYGDAHEFRDGLSQRGLIYVVGVQGTQRVWPPGARPVAPAGPTGRAGKRRIRPYDVNNPPVAIEKLAKTLDYKPVTWREGSRGKMTSRFAAIRIQTAVGYERSQPPGPMQWLLLEWPTREKEPSKFWLSTLPESISLNALARHAELRWRVERDYQDLKKEVGLDHFEGRTWRGLHHHAALCAVAHAFLALQRALFPPGGD